MSTENPVCFASSSSSSPHTSNAPWLVDMAAVAAAAVASSSSSKPVFEDGLLLSDLMDLDSLTAAQQEQDPVAGLPPCSPWRPLSQELHSQIIPNPQFLLRSLENSPQQSFRTTFSFDSGLIEELLGNDVTSMNFNFAAAEESSQAQEQQQQELQIQQIPHQPSWRISPTFNERLKEALRLISHSETEALAQVWVPVIQDDKILLTTQEQPYSVMHSKFDLLRYRTLSTAYMFPSKKDEAAEVCYLGLPGRVFSRKALEWTPNVQFYDSKEYLRIRDAACCDVKGLVAVPVIDPSSRSCLAVIELVTNVEKAGFESEISIICQALEAVNLAGLSEESSPVLQEIHTEGQEAVYAEIHEVLKAICEKYKLPLAQTWLPCHHNGKGSQEVLVGDSTGTGSGFENISLFTRDAPFYVSDSRFQGFRQACTEHRLEKGQGVAGKVYMSNQACFMSDIRNYSIEEYPLVHHVRYFKLGSAMAFRLRSVFTGAADYIVEFFLSVEEAASKVDQEALLLNKISATMQSLFGSLRIVSGEEKDFLLGGDSGGETNETSFESCLNPEEHVETVTNLTTKKHHLACSAPPVEAVFHRTKKTRPNIGTDLGDSSWYNAGEVSGKKKLERKKSMSEKNISLEVLQQYFAGSLKDAAKSIGVCPTTLKRICRQYGISRWPSRKINKVSRSLIKLQGVIDSVQGLDGAVKLNTLTGELASAAAAAAAITRRNNTAKEAGEASTSTFMEARMNPQELGLLQIEGGEQNMVSSDTDAEQLNIRGDSMNFGDPECQAPKRIKSEPRVHGSSAALAALNGEDIDIAEIMTRSGFQQFERLSSPEDGSRVEAYHNSSGDCASPSSSPQTFKSGPSHGGLSLTVTVKATMGTDTVRFRVPYTGFGYTRLREEVANRFKVEVDGFTLKYLDDDNEWVVLDGDADLEECLDVMKVAQAHTIKLSVKKSGNTSSHSLSSVKL